jgi:uncharacterized membrane protein
LAKHGLFKRRFLKRSISKRNLRLALGLLGLLVVLAYVAAPPWTLYGKAHLIGYAICHQIPDRTFVVGGRHLPLCARCTGTYLGIAIGLGTALLLRRGRAGELLSTPLLVLMGAFILTMAVDGLNSYLVLLGRAPLLYEPRNWLRTATGILNGIALSLIVLPVFNYTLWKDPQPVRPLKHAWNLLPMLAFGALVIALLQAGPAWMFYPMTLLSAGGVLGMLTLVNTMILLILARQDSQATHWKQAVLPLLGGLTVTLIELTTIGVARYLLTGTMGWPPA